MSRYADEKYVKPYKRNIVDVLISKSMVKRALEVANELSLFSKSKVTA